MCFGHSLARWLFISRAAAAEFIQRNNVIRWLASGINFTASNIKHPMPPSLAATALGITTIRISRASRSYPLWSAAAAAVRTVRV